MPYDALSLFSGFLVLRCTERDRPNIICKLLPRLRISLPGRYL